MFGIFFWHLGDGAQSWTVRCGQIFISIGWPPHTYARSIWRLWLYSWSRPHFCPLHLLERLHFPFLVIRSHNPIRYNLLLSTRHISRRFPRFFGLLCLEWLLFYLWSAKCYVLWTCTYHPIWMVFYPPSVKCPWISPLSTLFVFPSFYFPEPFGTQFEISPFPKSCNLIDPNNYRPIPLTSFSSKVFESAVSHQLQSFLEREELSPTSIPATSFHWWSAASSHCWPIALDNHGETHSVSPSTEFGTRTYWRTHARSDYPHLSCPQ